MRDSDDAIRRLMDKYGFSRDEALFILAHQHGPNSGDIRSTPPLTEEDERLLGIGIIAGPLADLPAGSRKP